MYCPKCGREVDDRAITCGWCGARLAVPSPVRPGGEPETCGVAIASLVLGVLIFCLGLFAAIPAVICGHMALGQIRRSGDTIAGRGMAIAGLVLGYSGIVLTILFILVGVIATKRGWEAAKRDMCKNNLILIREGCHTYAGENGGVYPDKLSRLYPKYVQTSESFRCPADKNHKMWEPLPTESIDKDASYVILPDRKPTDRPHREFIADKPQNHKSEGRNVLYTDGEVEWIPAKK